jgi:hypothetical protein
LRERIKGIPLVGSVAQWLHGRIVRRRSIFPGSDCYWEKRYVKGGDSGVGSLGKFAEFKAEIINGFVADHGVRSVIEYGCGDGNQLKLARYPEYIGFDVSERAVSTCRERFASDDTKSFKLLSDYDGECADLTLSLDVVYHLVEDEVFEAHMKILFESSAKHVIIYSSDTDDNRGYEGTHVRHRRFTAWIQKNLPGWGLIEHIPNRYPYEGDYRKGSFADFFVYRKEN